MNRKGLITNSLKKEHRQQRYISKYVPGNQDENKLVHFQFIAVNRVKKRVVFSNSAPVFYLSISDQYVLLFRVLVTINITPANIVRKESIISQTNAVSEVASCPIWLKGGTKILIAATTAIINPAINLAMFIILLCLHCFVMVRV